MFRLVHIPEAQERAQAAAIAHALDSRGVPTGPDGEHSLILLSDHTSYQWAGAAFADAYHRHRRQPAITLSLSEPGAPPAPRWSSPCPQLPMEVSPQSLASVVSALKPPVGWRAAPFAGLRLPLWSEAAWAWGDPLHAHPAPSRWPGVGDGLVLVGPPASGRGSWLYCVYLPQLAYEPPDGGPPWRLAVCTPGSSPLKGLYAALSRALRVPPSQARIDAALSALTGRVQVAIQGLERWLDHPAEGLEAAGLLAGWLSAGRPLAVTATMAEAAVARLVTFGPLGRWLQARVLYRGAPDVTQLAAALRHRAESAGRSWGPGALERVVDRAMRTPAPLAEAAWLAYECQRRVAPEDLLPPPDGPGLGDALEQWLSGQPTRTARACLRLWRGGRLLPGEDLRLAQVALADDALIPLGGGRSLPGRPQEPLSGHARAWWRLWPTLHRDDLATATGEEQSDLRSIAQSAHDAAEALRGCVPDEGRLTLRILTESLVALREALGDDPQGAQLLEAFGVATRALQGAQARGDLAAARAHGEDALTLARALVGLQPGAPKALRILSGALLQVADLDLEAGALEEAIDLTAEALVLRQELVEARPNALVHRRDLTVALERKSDLWILAGEADEAHSTLLEVRHLREALVEDHPKDDRLVHDLLITLTRLGELDVRSRRWSEGISAYQAAAKLARGLITAHPFDAGHARTSWQLEHRLGQLHLALGLYDQARTIMPSALHLAERWAHHPWGAEAAVRSLIALVEVEIADADPESARANLDEVILLLRDLPPQRALVPWWATAARLAAALATSPESALPWLDQSWRLWSRWVEEGPRPVEGLDPLRAWLETGEAFAGVAMRLRDHERAQRVVRALARWHGAQPPSHPLHRFAESVIRGLQADHAASVGHWALAHRYERQAVDALTAPMARDTVDPREVIRREEAEQRASIWGQLASAEEGAEGG